MLLRPFQMLDQVNAMVVACEADPELGFMGRMLALCRLLRMNPGNERYQYIRRNGAFRLVMTAGYRYKLTFGNLPRVLLDRRDQHPHQPFRCDRRRLAVSYGPVTTRRAAVTRPARSRRPTASSPASDP